MSLSTNPQEKPDKLTSADLRLRDSTTLWGPLQITIVKHREGTELGYRAGEEAYQDHARQYRRDIGLPTAEALREIMNTYFAMPRHRPRTITTKIADEWRSMFLLGWTSQVLQTSSFRTEPGLAPYESQADSTVRYQQRRNE